MHGNIPYLFDCWADLVVHLLLLKSSSMGGITVGVQSDIVERNSKLGRFMHKKEIFLFLQRLFCSSKLLQKSSSMLQRLSCE